jgi:uncharacterized protein (DUF1810 family)
VEDPYQLARFVAAQQGTYDQAVAELRRGRKTGHWIWYVFPQIAGLGMSPTSQRYAIGSLDEARAYLQHPVLGRRLVEAASVLLGNTDSTAEQILGELDAMKVRSSMTLFQRAQPDEPIFGRVLDRFFEGIPDAETLRRL